MNAITKTEQREPALPVPAVQAGDLLSDPAQFEHGQRVAVLFSKAELVPQHLRGKVADCFIALNIARRMGEDPITVMQNIYFVGGRAGWKTEYMVARANRSGAFKGGIRWRTSGTGKALSVTAYAFLSDGGDEVTATADMAMAEAEGWTKNAKYRSMPEHMLKWRAATMLIRLYCPEVMVGMPVREEVDELRGAPVEVQNLAASSSAADTSAAGMTAALAADATWSDDTPSPSLETAPSPVAGGAAEGDDSAAGTVLDVAAVEAPPVDLPAPLPGAGTIVELMVEAAVPEAWHERVIALMRDIVDAPSAAAVFKITDTARYQNALKALDQYPKVKTALIDAVKRGTEDRA